MTSEGGFGFNEVLVGVFEVPELDEFVSTAGREQFVVGGDL